MENLLEAIEPKNVFQHFERICQIPHGSYNTKALADYCESYATGKGLEAIRDGAGNLIITIPATKGHESASPVILQGHLDMVCVKDAASPHDFEKDPLKLVLKDDFIYADKTTLGADDGIGIAMCLAVMDDPSIVHPKLYCVFTTEEEVGMDGAYALDFTPIADATRMINLDSEDEGTVTVGCAGGARVVVTYNLHRLKARGLQTTLTVSGLAGGHSGDGISQFGYNANIVLGKILNEIAKKIDFSIISLNGGIKDNAIPQTARAELLIGPGEREELDLEVHRLQQIYRKMASPIDSNLAFTLAYGETRQFEVLAPDSEFLILFTLNMVPNGVQSMNRTAPDTVETSLNLGIVEMERSVATMIFNVRSTSNFDRDQICDQLCALADHLGGSSKTTGQYPAWPVRESSPLTLTLSEVYHQLFGKDLKVMTIHGGLECSLFAAAMPDLDIVSIGPDNLDIHTDNEHMSISSTARTWDFLKAVLEQLA